jgi:hypothetical protein
LKFEKEGYKPIEMQLTTSMNPWFWGNIVLGGFIGSTTDGITGAVYEYVPNQYLVNLTQIGSISAVGIESKKSSTRSFIITNYTTISMELNSTQGEYLKALYVLLDIPEPERPAAYEKIRSLSYDTKDIVKFADNVIVTYMH